MKCIKVDIKQEVLDVDNSPYFYFARVDKDMPKMLLDEASFPAEKVTFRKDLYRVFKVYNPYSKEKTVNYLLKENDKGLLDILLKVENDVIDNIINDKIGIFKELARMEVENIKKLPWWKRLFNKF